MKHEKFSVLIYPAAQRDFIEINEYFTGALKDSTNNLFQKVKESISLLEENPYIFPLVKDPFLNSLGYRMVPIENYLLFYVIKEETVQLHRFLYGKRDYQSIL